jgi:hypothetical protein
MLVQVMMQAMMQMVMQAMGDVGVCDNDNQNYERTLHETSTKVKFVTSIRFFNFKPINHHFQ